MAVSYVWPATLPQAVRPDFNEQRGALILRTPMDAGPAKMRRRGNMPAALSVTFNMTDAQVSTLQTFVETTIKGTARFGFPHPRTGTQIEARIVPSGDGQLYGVSYNGPDAWVVSMTLESLP